MLKPSGSQASEVDPLILLNIWAHHLDQQLETHPKVIFAGIGKPSYLLNEDVAASAVQYWSTLLDATRSLKNTLPSSLSPEDLTDSMSESTTAIDYGLPGGTREAQELMAFGLSKWYGPQVDIQPDDLVFTVGGLAGLTMLFKILREVNPHGKIVTPSPYYPFYNVKGHAHRLHVVDVMKEAGYRLTADVLEEAIQDLEKQNTPINAFLFCDPYNPLGSLVGEEEWGKIAAILRKTPENIPIILDEAYSELTFHSKHVSLLMIAPDLRDRLIVLRTGTKGFSASGERLAVLICFNEEMRERLLDEMLFTNIHAPKSLQLAYASGIASLTEDKRKALADHYHVQVNYVQERLRKLGLALPDSSYKIEGSFYVLADLSPFFGQVIPKAAEKALGKGGAILTDEDICYSLLFEDSIMISPLSYFGADPKLGYLRITCSGGVALLSKLLDRLQDRLTHHFV